ncbi:Dbl homology domain-containing protein, partial [Kickxella alabastrina]|uniref:Dbl homology domain-containing protein n=1 Tax=Kickxella alabastrina TaxID=61397 RepID=UPI00221FEB4E
MAEDTSNGTSTNSSITVADANTERTRTQRSSKRANIAAEILETERTYVDGLGLIEKLYITPLLLSAQQPTAILSRKEVRQLFANFPDIIMLSRELLYQLESRLGPNASPPWDADTGRVGDIFLRIAPFLKMYSLYLRNFRSALADISRWLSSNHEFAQFIQQANSNPECKSLAFQSYLLLPVQRIPRYKMLLEDLLKHTPETHVDHQNIGDALRTIEDVATFVNENIQEHEMTLSIIEIQRMLGLKESLLVPGRRLIKTGTLSKICRKNHQLRNFYLFSDILLYSSSPAPLSDDQSGHRRVPLEDCKVMDVPDAPDCRNQFTIISREKSFIVYTSSASEKLAWMQALMRAITERREARDTLQMDSSLKRRIARARRSTMMQFPRVAENFDAPVWDPDESAERCYICFRDFSLFVRKHHCRACGKIVCNGCSRKNIVFVAQESTEAKEGRGCDQCI